MSKLFPDAIRDEIWKAIYAEADSFGYLRKTRPENAIWMAGLVENPQIGGKLKEFIPKEKVKTYIKDAVLNRYSKEKRKEDIPANREGPIKAVLGFDSIEIERDPSDVVSLHQDPTRSNYFVVVASGTYLKWETALRRALEFRAHCPGLKKGGNCEMLLLLTPSGRSLPKSDKDHLFAALHFANAKAWFGGAHN